MPLANGGHELHRRCMPSETCGEMQAVRNEKLHLGGGLTAIRLHASLNYRGLPSAPRRTGLY